MIAQLAEVGWITIYHPKTGRMESPAIKLVEFLRSEGYHPIYVGGSQQTKNSYQHLIEQVFPELRFQASNVFALMPGEVISYEGNQRNTLAALRESGIIVHTFESHELVRWKGGPHCMALPIQRHNS